MSVLAPKSRANSIKHHRIPIAIRGAPRPYAQAITSSLDPARFAVEDPSQAIDLSDVGNCGAPLMLRDEESWSQLDQLTELADVTVVAITPELGVGQFARALAAGCDGVVHQDTSVEIIISVLEAALGGEVILPKEAARELASSHLGARQPTPNFTTEERNLLAGLARGQTIVELSRQLGWSERTLRRRLQNASIKLRVENRAQAIARATQLGLID